MGELGVFLGISLFSVLMILKPRCSIFSRIALGSSWMVVSREDHWGGAPEVVLVVENSPASAADVRDTSLILGSGRPPGGGYGSPLQYSCLGNPMDRGTWLATVHSVGKTWTQLKQLSTYYIFRERQSKSGKNVNCNFSISLKISK